MTMFSNLKGKIDFFSSKLKTEPSKLKKNKSEVINNSSSVQQYRNFLFQRTDATLRVKKKKIISVEFRHIFVYIDCIFIYI